MFSENIRVLPAGLALERTFSSEGRCKLCSAVTTAKQEQSERDAPAPGGKIDGKILLALEPTFALLRAAENPASWDDPSRPLTGTGRAAPPLPPPRA